MNQPEQLDVIGLLPAGGQATRLSPLPLSKELFPVGFQTAGETKSLRPKTVCHHLLEKMRLAGITKAFFILRPGKWDIPAYFGDGAMLDMHLGYLTVHVPHGVPYTLNQAYPFVKDARIALGFPDILFQPDEAFIHLLAHQTKHQADVVLGLFPTRQYWKAGMVDFDQTGRVHQIIEKPQQTDLQYMWAIAVWTPHFTQFMHEYLKTFIPDRELPLGNVIQAGIDSGMRVEAVPFADGSYLDVGTPEDLIKAIRDLVPKEEQSENPD